MIAGNRTMIDKRGAGSVRAAEARGVRIGIDLGGTKCAGAIFDRERREMRRLRIPTPRGDYAGTLQAIAGLIAVLQKSAPEQASVVGVGMPGIIDPQTGLVKNCNATWIQGKAFHDDLEAILGLPVRVANDGNCFAIAEALHGAARGAQIVFGATLGTGCGGGIVIDGKPINGHHGISGEWGHFAIPWPTEQDRQGRDCFCGKSDCIERYLSGGGLALDYAEISGRSIQAQEIPDLLAAGDAAAEEAMERYENRLGRSLAIVVDILDPDVIVLGGGVLNIDRLYRNLPPLIEKFAFSEHIQTPLVKAVHGDSGGVLGAALLWEEPV